MVIRNVAGSATAVLIFILTLMLVANYYWDDIQTTLFGDTDVVTVYVGQVPFSARVADTPEERSQGLSGTEPLKNNEAMLFVFPEPNRYGFWMKDMNYPIDILWFDTSFELVHIKENATPESYPTSFVSDEHAQYVLEIPAFAAEKHDLEEGMRISIPQSILSSGI